MLAISCAFHMYTFGSTVRVPFVMEIGLDPFLFPPVLSNFPEEAETIIKK